MRPFRPLALVAVGAIILAGGALGFALPAFAANATFTAQITGIAGNGDSSPNPDITYVTDQSAFITFGGTKPSGDVITSITILNQGVDDNSGPKSIPESSDCHYGTGTSSWSCTYGPPADDSGFTFNAQDYNTIQVNDTTAAGVKVHHFITFDVYNSEEDPERTPAEAGDTGYAQHSISFSPGHVSVTGTPGPEETFVGMDIASDAGEDPVCPNDFSAGDGVSFGGMIDHEEDTGSQACTIALLQTSDEVMRDRGLPWFMDTYEADSDGQIPTDGAGDSEGQQMLAEEYFVEYQPPVITSVTDAGNGTATITGTGGVRDASIKVYDENGNVACTVATTANGWTCTTSALAFGTHTFKATLTDNGAGESDVAQVRNYTNLVYLPGAVSSYSAAKSVLLAAPIVTTTATPTPTPTPSATALVWGFSINGIDPNNMKPGQHFTITGQGLPGGTTVAGEIHSKPEFLGSTVVDSTGAFILHATVPKDLPAGPHTIIVTATGPAITSGGSQQQSVKLAKSKVKTEPTQPITVVSANSPTAPNILTKGLQPFADVAAHPNKIISAVEIGLVLLLLAAFPAHLLESTIAEQSERFERRFKNRPKQPAWIGRLVAWFKRAPVASGIIVTTATGILFGFADPEFGFTLASLRLVLAAAIALFLVGFLANFLTGIIARVAWKVEAEIHTRPWGLILTVVGVILSRLLHFAPGFLIGLILGLAIEGRAARGFAWRLVATRAIIVIVFAVLAWTGYSLLTLNGTEGGTFWSELGIETLVAITTEGIVALLVELLPLRFLEGERLYAKSRILWGVFYLVTVAVFVIAIVPWEGNWDALGSSLWIWIGVLALFALICIGIYVYFRRFAKPQEEEEGSEEVALGETVSGDRS